MGAERLARDDWWDPQKICAGEKGNCCSPRADTKGLYLGDIRERRLSTGSPPGLLTVLACG